MGRRTSMTDGQGTTSYAYDPANGSLTGLKYPDGTQITYEYNKQSRTGYVLTDASGTSMHVQSKLDSLGRVTQMDVSSGADTANVQSLSGATTAAAGGSLDRMTFDYAPNGLLKGQSSSRGLSTRFSYNGLDLSGVTVEQGGTALHQFGYERDGNKNIIGRTQNGTTDQFGYDPSNRIASEAAGEKNKTYGYDPNGNRSAEGSGKVFGMENASYGYDSVSRLTNVSGEGKEVGYSYNGDGLLYERTEGGKTTRYYYDEEAKLMAEAEVEGGAAKITYVYVYDLSGQLWARQDKASGQLQYYQLNGHGDVVGLGDSMGKELNSYSYDIWGGPETVKETVPNVLRYAGEYWDDTTGLQYLRARWYDPGTARFMGEDTYQGEMSDPRSLNGYAYVANNPLKYTDPSGHKVWLVHGTFAYLNTWNNSKNYIEKELFHEPIDTPRWSGKNKNGARVKGAKIVANEIYNYHQTHPKEPIRIMGHSHGGNVSIMATNILAKRGVHVDTLITIATPVRGYKLKTDVGQHINVYNDYDLVQKELGGSIWTLGQAMRTFSGAENVKVKLSSYFSTHRIEAHSVMHNNPNTLDKYVKPLLLQHNFSEARYKNSMKN
ncbi:hypothetical protein E0698_08950 [Paenibacillus sp. 23TSA30-6]|nr:hypothetical protein [Paenibacillus sp. 23TSA30-6]